MLGTLSDTSGSETCVDGSVSSAGSISGADTVSTWASASDVLDGVGSDGAAADDAVAGASVGAGDVVFAPHPAVLIRSKPARRSTNILRCFMLITSAYKDTDARLKVQRESELFYGDYIECTMPGLSSIDSSTSGASSCSMCRRCS